MSAATGRRSNYFNRIISLMEKYPKVLVVHADHVGSRQMADVRFQLRGKAIVMMGKNTMIRTALKRLSAQLPQVATLIPEIKLNIGLVFCIDEPVDVRKVILANKVPSAARQGLIAPVNVKVPAGPTGLDPSQTSFFQALSITTKIVKGQIEIQSEVHLITEGEKVTPSQSTLLQKLNIRPFAYGLVPLKVYDDGQLFDSKVLDMTDDDLVLKLKTAAANVAALSRVAGFPTAASAPHSLIEAIKNCLAISEECGNDL